MTEEPYRWLEAMGNRREYVREQLKDGSPCFAASLPDGLLLLGVGMGGGVSKVFEIHDRVAMAALGHPADIERVRQAAIDAAHLEAFARAPEDVSLRRLVAYGLSGQIKQAFEQLFSAPVLAEFLLVEVASVASRDLLVRLRFDGTFVAREGGIAVVAPDPDVERSAAEWLEDALAGVTGREAATGVLLEAWKRIQTGGSFSSAGAPGAVPGESPRSPLAGRTPELAWLRRGAGKAARYEWIPMAPPALSASQP